MSSIYITNKLWTPQYDYYITDQPMPVPSSPPYTTIQANGRFYGFRRPKNDYKVSVKGYILGTSAYDASSKAYNIAKWVVQDGQVIIIGAWGSGQYVVYVESYNITPIPGVPLKWTVDIDGKVRNNIWY
jgi:hypothetical protein